MLGFYEKAQSAGFVQQGFLETMKQARPGDVLYCDPPYVPLSETACFTSYSTGGFGMNEQQQLAEMAEELSNKGIPVIVSNHDTPFTQQAYQKARIIPFMVQRYISCNGAERNKAKEVLAVFS